jgi:hypothetical protein
MQKNSHEKAQKSCAGLDHQLGGRPSLDYLCFLCLFVAILKPALTLAHRKPNPIVINHSKMHEALWFAGQVIRDDPDCQWIDKDVYFCRTSHINHRGANQDASNQAQSTGAIPALS